MDSLDEFEPKTKRIRRNPVKKWTTAEENDLIKFMLKNRKFEKPCARVYYKRFMEEAKIDLIDWKIARSKVRNMRTTYNKAKAWLESASAENMVEETMKSTLLKMCPFFDQFEDYFGSRQVDDTVVKKSLDSASNESWISLDENEYIDDTNNTTENESISGRNVCNISSEVECVNIPTSSRRCNSRTEMSEIKWKQDKLDQDKAFREKELALKERELSLRERELELKTKELESKERIKIRRLEMKEKLGLEELKLKYSKS